MKRQNDQEKWTTIAMVAVESLKYLTAREQRRSSRLELITTAIVVATVLILHFA